MFKLFKISPNLEINNNLDKCVTLLLMNMQSEREYFISVRLNSIKFGTFLNSSLTT